MSLQSGTRLGIYEIVSPIGAGGMGEVYRARDTPLNRDVAIKVLPDAFALDADRVARFTREAQVLASLNHPNIAAIYGIEEHALVMELVEGRDLSEIIRAAGAQGLPLADALPIARQIADALEVAHEQGIVHRDLKPQNIKVRADGTVKVLDFGLAKAIDPGSPGPQDVLNSPTMTARMTQMGMIVGTAAYMAPEQAKGKPVDRRADIWAFGVVLHEMLSGRHMFMADTIPETLAHVMTRVADLDTLPCTTPRQVRELVARCLEKDPKKRLRDIGEARLVLEDPATLQPDGAASPSANALAAPPAPRWQRGLPWAVAAVLGTGFIVALGFWAPWRTASVPSPRKLLVSIGADAALATGYGASAILSPDGATLVFVARPPGAAPRLFIRKLDQLQAEPIAGTDGASSPFFSPSGQWIAFFSGTKLKKVSVTGGAAVDVCDAPAGRGGTWVDDETIVFTPAASQPTRLMRVSASNGTPVEFVPFIEGGTTQRWPQALPGGTAILYTENNSGSQFDSANLVVAPISGGAPKIIVRGAYFGRYVPSGHLLYLQQGTVFAVPFDIDRLEIDGQAVTAVEGVSATSEFGSAHLAFSDEGTLAYIPGTASVGTVPIDWMTRDGRSSVLRSAKSRWTDPKFSPDGRRLALAINDGKQRDIWMYEWASGRMTQLTFDAGEDRLPAWTSDSKRIAFASDRANKGVLNLYLLNADAPGEPIRLTNSPNDQRPSSWHPTDRVLAFQEFRGGATRQDLLMLPMEGDAARGWTPGTPTVFLAGPANEGAPAFSPDGRWLAYQLNEGTGSDIWVRPFPGPGGQFRVSTEGGSWPSWSPSRELVFTDPRQNKVMSAPYTVVGDSFKADTPQMWSATSYQTVSGNGGQYALHPDGKRLALVAATETVVQDKIGLITNFFDYLRKIAPVKK